MSKNFKYSGKRVTIKNLAAAVAAGNFSRQKGFLGMPLNHAPTAGSVAFALEGVWGMTFAHYAGIGAGSLPAVGTILYWDVANATFSIGSGANDYPAVKCVTAVSATDGSFDGLMYPGWDRPKTADQS